VELSDGGNVEQDESADGTVNRESCTRRTRGSVFELLDGADDVAGQRVVGIVIVRHVQGGI
jgi:hypothetical protein